MVFRKGPFLKPLPLRGWAVPCPGVGLPEPAGTGWSWLCPPHSLELSTELLLAWGGGRNIRHRQRHWGWEESAGKLGTGPRVRQGLDGVSRAVGTRGGGPGGAGWAPRPWVTAVCLQRCLWVKGTRISAKQSSISSPSVISAGAFTVVLSPCKTSAFESEEKSLQWSVNPNVVLVLFYEISSNTWLWRFVTWRIKQL